MITDIPFAEYLANPGFGSSDLRTFRVGPPAMVPWRRANRTQTDATKLGSAAHCRILTPHMFTSAYWVKPDGMEFRSKENKQVRDDLLARGVEIIGTEELAKVDGVLESLNAKGVRDMPNVERSIFWTDTDSDLACKSRPDWWDGDAIYDLKVSIAADRKFEDLIYYCFGRGWMHQLAHGRAGLAEHGINVRVGRLVVVSPNAPHTVHLMEVRENDLDFLELDNQDARRGIAHCLKTGHWPGTPDKWQTIELPASAAFTESDLEGAEEALPL